MNYRNLILVVSFLVNACSKKDKHDNNLSATYQSGNTLIIDQLALYTDDGIHTDVALIQGYINRNVGDQQFRERFFVGQTTVTDPLIGKELVIIDEKKAELNRRPMEIIQKNDTLLMLAEMDSIAVPANKDDRCQELPALVPSITAATYCPAGSCTKYRKTYPIIVSGGDYYLPTLYYYTTHSEWFLSNGFYGKVSCGALSPEYPVLNFLNKNLSASLENMDTVLVQVGRVKMNKR